jgi:hypothetical protein
MVVIEHVLAADLLGEFDRQVRSLSLHVANNVQRLFFGGSEHHRDIGVTALIRDL